MDGAVIKDFVLNTTNSETIENECTLCNIRSENFLPFAMSLGNSKHLVTGPKGNSEFCFPRISMFPETKSRETLRFEGNKIHCFPTDQSLSDLLYSKKKTKANFEKRAGIPATKSGHLQLHALITSNSGQHFAGNSELFPV